ncbi:hypothetical protein, partial [Paenibacillus oleatilyticus]|uniref:hypothetical protein n=1 Tax=Paenibacillus oleatilyticus TaxID=2594886 RepID=UPI001C200340
EMVLHYFDEQGLNTFVVSLFRCRKKSEADALKNTSVSPQSNRPDTVVVLTFCSHNLPHC